MPTYATITSYEFTKRSTRDIHYRKTARACSGEAHTAVHASGACATSGVLAVLGAPSTPADIATVTPPVCDRLQAVQLIVLGGPRCWPPGREFPDIRGPRRGQPRRQRHK